jgi:hypothetical protein
MMTDPLRLCNTFALSQPPRTRGAFYILDQYGFPIFGFEEPLFDGQVTIVPTSSP